MEAFKQIESFERELVSMDVRKDTKRISELLSDEFQEFGSSGGVIRKHDVVDAAENPGTTMYQLDGFNFKALGEAYILVTYRSVTSSHAVAHRSSIWANEFGRWRMLHHQSTLVPGEVLRS